MSATHDPYARLVYSALAYKYPNVRGYFNALCMTHGCNRDPREVYAASLRARTRYQGQAAPDKQETPQPASREVSTNKRSIQEPSWSLKAA